MRWRTARDLRPLIDTWNGSWPHGAGLIGAWVAVAALSRVAGLRVDPTTSVDRPLESLGTLALILPCAVTTEMLITRVPWLAAAAARNLLVWRGGRLLSLVAVQLPALVAVSAVAHAPVRQLLCVWGLLLATAVGSLAAGGRAAAGMVPAAVVIGFTQGTGVPPWSWNLLYNVERLHTLQGVTAVVSLAAALLYVRRGDRAR